MTTNYVDTLSNKDQLSYKNKIESLEICDPYLESSYEHLTDEEDDGWPNVHYMDIVNYLLYAKNSVTQEQMKNFKSLKSYCYFVDGLVHNLGSKVYGNKILIIAKVKHSQKVSEKPLQPWVVVEKNGTVLGAHCNCMAGLGESCSHIGALLFALEAGCRINKNKSATQKACNWKKPSLSCAYRVPFKEVCNMNFDPPETKRKKFNETTTPSMSSSVNPPTTSHIESNIINNNPFDKNNFFKCLSQLSPNSSILTIIPKINQEAESLELPPPLTELFDSKYLDFHYTDLVKLAENYNWNYTDELCKKIECATRNQSKCKEWFHQRAGRVTASKIKQCCSTNICKPSLCLLKQICYPKQQSFISIATQWGCDHESKALAQYSTFMKKKS